MSDKNRTNRKWTSSEQSRANYDLIFGKPSVCLTCGGKGEIEGTVSVRSLGDEILIKDKTARILCTACKTKESL